MRRPSTRVLAGAVALATVSLPVHAQTAGLGGAAALAPLPRFVSASPAEPGDVPGVSLAYEEPRAPSSVAAGGGGAWRAWGQYVFTSSRVGADANGAAIRSSSDGLAVGIERALDPTLSVGLSFGYSSGKASSLGVKSDIEAYSGAGYAWWNPVAGLELDALAGISGLDVSTRRRVTLGGAPAVLEGSSGGIGFSGLGAVGYRFRFEGERGPAYLKPYLSLAYANQDRGAYAETAAGGGLAFPGRGFERATVNLGASTGIDLQTPWGFNPRPEVSLSWSRYLFDPSPAVSVFDIATGQGYVLRDPRPGNDGLVVATEMSVWEGAGVQGFVGYTGEFRENATAHQARVGLRSSW